MRSEKDILSDIKYLALEPGFVHVVAALCFRDNFVGYKDELTSEEYAKLFSWSRLIRTEMSTLIGYMIKGGIEIGAYSETIINANVKKVDELFLELHNQMTADFLPDLEAAMRGEIDDPFASARGMREPIFYGGESAYSFQYRDFAPQKYANDRTWLIEHIGFDAEEARRIIKCIHDICQSKLDIIVTKLRSYQETHLDILDIFSFSFEEIARASNITEIKITSFLERYSVSAYANSHFEELSDFNESDARPIIKTKGRFICFQYVSLVEASYNSPSFWFKEDDKYSNTAAKNRGDFLEEFSQTRLANVFGKDNVFSNIKIMSGRNEIGEIDTIVKYFNRIILIQAKSKRLTIAARKGNDGQLKDDFKKAIQKTTDQCRSCCKLILSRKHKLKDVSGNEIQIPPDLTEIFPVCLISDHYPALSFQSRAFLRFEADITTKQIFVMDIFALDAICEMLDTPLRFLSYLQLRAKIGLQISVSHELTALSFHLRQNLWVKGFDFIHMEDDISAPLDIAMAVRRDGVKGQNTPEGILTELEGTRAGKLIDDIKDTQNKSLFEFGLMLARLDTNSAIKIGEYIDRLAGQTGPNVHKDLTIWKDEDESGVTLHCNNFPMLEACEHLEKHCVRRKYAQKASAWFGVLIEPLSGIIRQGITLTYPWSESDELNKITASMPAPTSMRNVSRQLERRRKIGRNDKCPCGSKLKYKRCCGR